MSDINKAIARWQSRLAEDGNLSADQIDELTTHLLDQCEALRAARLDEQEAFLIAARRVGRPADLSAEFTKLNPLMRWRSRLFWMVCGYLACTLLGALLVMPAGVLLTGMQVGLLESAIITFTCVSILAAVACLLIGITRLTRRLSR